MARLLFGAAQLENQKSNTKALSIPVPFATTSACNLDFPLYFIEKLASQPFEPLERFALLLVFVRQGMRG